MQYNTCLNLNKQQQKDIHNVISCFMFAFSLYDSALHCPSGSKDKLAPFVSTSSISFQLFKQFQT